MKAPFLWLRFATCALLGSFALVSAATSEARSIRVDSGDTFFINGTEGALWADPQAISVQNSVLDFGPTAANSPYGFSIDFGTGNVGQMFVNLNGFVSFGVAIDPDPTTELPSGSYIAPYFADLQPNRVTYALGILNRNATGDPVADEAAADPALRVIWENAGGDSLAQLVLIQINDNPLDFDIEFNYGFGDILAAPVFAGFQLGTDPVNAASYSGEFSADSNITFSFRDGKYVSGAPPVTVPEPSTWSLLLLGLGVLALRTHRQKFRQLAGSMR